MTPIIDRGAEDLQGIATVVQPPKCGPRVASALSGVADATDAAPARLPDSVSIEVLRFD